MRHWLQQEKQGHANHGNQGAYHFLDGDLLLVDDGVRHDDEHGRERLLAVSANKAVAVHEKATMRAIISPK